MSDTLFIRMLIFLALCCLYGRSVCISCIHTLNTPLYASSSAHPQAIYLQCISMFYVVFVFPDVLVLYNPILIARVLLFLKISTFE